MVDTIGLYMWIQRILGDLQVDMNVDRSTPAAHVGPVILLPPPLAAGALSCRELRAMRAMWAACMEWGAGPARALAWRHSGGRLPRDVGCSA
jgi:hypothetical protein